MHTKRILLKAAAAATLLLAGTAANAATPIFMAHGTQDPVVQLPRAEASRDALKALGYAVDWHTYPMPHSLHPKEVADIGAFLRKVL